MPDEFGNERGRMLQVRIERDDGVAIGVFEPGRESRLVAEVAAQGQIANARIGAGHAAQHFERAVARAVVHINDFEFVIG